MLQFSIYRPQEKVFPLNWEYNCKVEIISEFVASPRQLTSEHMELIIEPTHPLALSGKRSAKGITCLKKEMSRTATYCNVHIEIVSGADKSIFLDTRPNFYLFLFSRGLVFLVWSWGITRKSRSALLTKEYEYFDQLTNLRRWSQVGIVLCISLLKENGVSFHEGSRH